MDVRVLREASGTLVVAFACSVVVGLFFAEDEA